jgi:hypothetical protein
MNKELSDKLALSAFRIESEIENRQLVEEEAKFLAELVSKNAKIVLEELRKCIDHEIALREINQERKRREDRRLLFIILFFILKMMEDDADYYASQPDEYFEELSGGSVAPLYNEF